MALCQLKVDSFIDDKHIDDMDFIKLLKETNT